MSAVRLGDSLGRATIEVLHRGLTLGDVEVGDGYLATTVGGMVRVYSCYAFPALSVDGFERLGHFDGYGGVELDLIVASDFNARSVSWGDRFTKRRVTISRH